MKLYMNWGYKLLLTFVVFACMMGYLVFRAFNTNFELVKSDYYKDELRYQQVIDGTDRANMLSASPAITQKGSNITLQMPEEMKNKTVTGHVWFYCAYNSKKDRKHELSIDKNGEQLFNGSLTPGNYTMKIDWNADGKNYYAEKNLTIL
ncbi:MAG: FixH family protein [Bacteroidota bacterium]